MPLDYATPSGPHIGIALIRRPAGRPETRLGSVVIDPGGPGESGLLNFDKDLSILPGSVLERFDMIGFDARGIGQSSPLHCADAASAAPGTATTAAPDPVPETAAAQQAAAAADRAYGEACAHYSGGSLLAHVGSTDVARDLEVLRVAVGDPALSFIGLSYGTLLGATYADLFPTRVRAMVLDGIYDPSLSTDEVADAQAAGFERSLDAFLAWCQAAGEGCGWSPGPHPHRAFRDLVAVLRAKPLGALGVGELDTAVFGTLYARNWWPSLGRAIGSASRGDGAALLALYNGYQHTGDPSFSPEANSAVTCLDHPVSRDLASYPARARAAASVAPDFGALFAWAELSCALWPVPPSAIRLPHRILAPGSGPILVVGTRNDPATPYSWAGSLAGQLQHGVLLTREGVDHVALFYSECVRAAAASVLIELRLPTAGTVCAS
ncbi:MAG: alpha/beta hydrolase [Acidimicrobiales bacterium]